MSENTTEQSGQVTVTQAGHANTLEAFVFEKTQKASDVLVEAQRLVNLYRQLNALGKDFVPVFDQMLLTSKPEVQLALSGLSSGDMVRQYLKFLQSRKGENNIDAESNVVSEDVSEFLPSPDDIPPFQMTPTIVAGEGTATVAQSELLNAVIQAFSAAQQKQLEQQNAFLKQALEQLQQSAGKQSSDAGFDMAGFQQTQQKMMNETIERLAGKQAELLAGALSDVVHMTQKNAREQMQQISSLIAGAGIGSGAYPHVEEVDSVAGNERASVEQKKAPTPESIQSAPMPPDIPGDIEILSEVDLPTDHI